MGDKYLGARSNEFGYANYEIIPARGRAEPAEAGGSPALSVAIGRLLREPLLQFLLLGLLLFVGYSRRCAARDGSARASPAASSSPRTICGRSALAWVAQGRAAPSPEEMRSLVDARVREEILYREALALGLDKDDTIVRRRMAQKMEFLFEDVAALREPTSRRAPGVVREERGALHAARRAPRSVISTSPPTGAGRARATTRRGRSQKIAGEPVDSPEAAALGDPFMFQDYYGDRASDEVAKTFGPGFARALFQLAPGAWAGPIESGYGWHLVWVDAMTPARVPAFEEVEPDVKTAWIEDQRAEIRREGVRGDAGALRGRPAEGPDADGRSRHAARRSSRPLAAVAPQ